MEVSVIVTNYNKGDLIDVALCSVMAQECPFDFEVIVVDDASTDHSPEIVRSYAERYPQQVRAYFHETNQGITKTWVEACRYVTGRYVARLDGDDWWTDTHKLEKQVAALDARGGSGWCTTDFDIHDAAGKLVGPSAIKGGLLPHMTCFEDMLARKGMTMSSTWLVDAPLMQEVARAISPDAVDDTFSMQLELFMRTSPVFLEESMAAYRLAEESDSHTIDSQKMASRVERLAQTQAEYLAKKDDIDWPLLARLFLDEECAKEKVIYQLREERAAAQEYLASVEADREGLRAEKTRVQDELTAAVEAAHAENSRIYGELSGMVRDLQGRLEQAEADRDAARADLEAILSSKRWQMASKVAGLLGRKG